MTGYVKGQRARFSHPLFRASKRNPFCQGYAWDWLVAHAAWKPHRISVAGKVVLLQRGQLCHSIRHLADTWGWSKSATERFLLRLQTETMIETDAGTGQTIITICNYDRYQSTEDSDRDDAAQANWDSSGTAAGQDRRREEREEDKKESLPSSASDPTTARATDDADDWTHREQLLVAMGHDRTGVTAAGRIVGDLSDMAEVERWRGLGIPDADQIATVRGVMARKRDGPPIRFRYFRQAMQELAAARAEPALSARPAQSSNVVPLPAFDLDEFKRRNPNLA